MKILVVSSCSERQCNDYAPAAELYTGHNHTPLMEGLREVRKCDQSGKTTVDLFILSTKHGLICERDVIAPYNVEPEHAIWNQNPGCVYQKLRGIIENNQYDLVFFLLGQDVKALQLREKSFWYSGTTDLIFLLAPTNRRNYLPSDLPPNIHVVEAGIELANEIEEADTYNLRGFLFKKLCEAACREGLQVFEEARQNPQIIRDIAQGGHTLYDLKYHIVWITKYRYQVLRGDIALRARDLIREICQSREVSVIRGSLAPGHVHILVSSPPSLSVSDLVQYVKSRSSHKLQREFPSLRKRYEGQPLWARGYFCATVGAVDEERIKAYTEVM